MMMKVANIVMRTGAPVLEPNDSMFFEVPTYNYHLHAHVPHSRFEASIDVDELPIIY